MIRDHGYVCIVRWGRYLGSRDYYIQDQCDLAEQEGAPENAIYPRRQPGLPHRPEDGWATAGEVTNPAARTALGP
jgi:hypothetical protein